LYGDFGGAQDRSLCSWGWGRNRPDRKYWLSTAGLTGEQGGLVPSSCSTEIRGNRYTKCMPWAWRMHKTLK